MTQHGGWFEAKHENEEIITREDWARKNSEDAADRAEAQAYAASPDGRRDAAYRKATAMDAAAIDSGLYTDDERRAAWDAYRAIDDEITADAAARFAGEWTRDVTIGRRAEWNAWVKAQPARKSVSWNAIHAQEQRQGWTMDDLKQAVALHQL